MENSGKEGDSNQNTHGEKSLSSIVQNMALAHEVVMDKDFKLNEVPSDSIEGQVKQIVHKAFWDHLEEEITQDPPNYGPAIKLLAELKETLLSVLFDHNVSLQEQINNVLDIDLITQQSDQGVVDIQGYAAYIIRVISKICTPERDEDVEKLKKVEGLVPLFREIFRVLDLMKLDMANFRLSLIRPQLVQQSVEFERKQFQEYLNANPNGLLSTKQWIKRGLEAAERTQNEQADNCEEHSDSKDGRSSPETCHGATAFHAKAEQTVPDLTEVLKHSYIGILLGEGGFPYPETLLMDQHRLVGMRLSMQCLVRVASILVVTLNLVGRHLASDSEYRKTLKETVYVLLTGIPESQLQTVFPNICEQVIKETKSFISKRGLADLREEIINDLRVQIANLAADDHSVCRLMKKRAYGFVMGNLLTTKGSSSPVSLPAAFTDVETEVIELTKQFSHTVSHNHAVYQPFYEEVIKQLS